MNYKNFKRCVNSPKYPRFYLPYTVLTCASYQEFKFEVTKWRNYYISAIEREENKDERTSRMDFVSELDYMVGIAERLEKV